MALKALTRILGINSLDIMTNMLDKPLIDLYLRYELSNQPQAQGESHGQGIRIHQSEWKKSDRG